MRFYILGDWHLPMIIEKVVLSLLDDKVCRSMERRILALDWMSCFRGNFCLLWLLNENAMLTQQILLLLSIHTFTLWPKTISCPFEMVPLLHLKCLLTPVSFIQLRWLATMTMLIWNRIHTWQVMRLHESYNSLSYIYTSRISLALSCFCCCEAFANIFLLYFKSSCNMSWSLITISILLRSEIRSLHWYFFCLNISICIRWLYMSFAFKIFNLFRRFSLWLTLWHFFSRLYFLEKH